MNEEEPGATIRADSTCEAAKKIKINLSLHNLAAARHFSEKVGELETEFAGMTFSECLPELLANGSACIMMTCAALEAYVNELFDSPQFHFKSEQQDWVHLLIPQYGRASMLDKYDLFLVLRGCEKLDRGSGNTQMLVDLIQLRNALVHFKPEWSGDPGGHSKLSNRLRGKFDPSKFFPDTEPLFPLAWCSHSCTRWATSSAYEFLREIEITADLPQNIKLHLSLLAR